MSYTISSFRRNYYFPTDTVICADAETETANYTPYTKVKTLRLTQPINPNSRFRYKFDLKSGAAGGANTTYGKIYKNGVAIGTEQTEDTNTWTTYTEDIDIGNWIVGDEIQLYVKLIGSVLGQCRELQLCGTGSEWVKI